MKTVRWFALAAGVNPVVAAATTMLSPAAESATLYVDAPEPGCGFA
jgi:hypothetical protein